MAAVTQTNYKGSVWGDCRVKLMAVSGATGDTISVNWQRVLIVLFAPNSLITAYTVTGTPGDLDITLTAGGPFTNIPIVIIGE